MIRNSINWKIFAILVGLCLLSILCVFPYVLTVQSNVFDQLDVPITTILTAQLIQSLIMFSIVVYLGLRLAKQINFQLPLLEAIVGKGNYQSILKSIAGKSMVAGTATALMIYGLDFLFTWLGAALSTHQSYAPIWQKLLAAVYGGVTEEVLMRLFFMSFFVWISMKLFKQKQPSNTGIIISIILAAIIFGLGHLPITASLTALTPLIISRAVVLNGVGGLVFGWLYWKYGLESAMIAHFTTDIFLLSLLPLVFQV